VAMILTADSLREVGRGGEALAMAQKVVATHRRASGDDDPHTLQAVFLLAKEFGSMGEHEKALELYETCLVKERLLRDGHDDERTLFLLNQVAQGNLTLKRYEKWLEVNQELLPKMETIFGAGDPRTLDALADVANGLARFERNAESLVRYEQLYERRSRVLGSEDSETLATLGSLAFQQHATGNTKEAQANWSKGRAIAKNIGHDKLIDTFLMALSHCGGFEESTEEKQLREKIRLRKHAVKEKAAAEATRLATPQPKTSAKDLDDLMAEFGFEEDTWREKKSKKEAAGGGGGGSTKKKKGKKGKG